MSLRNSIFSLILAGIPLISIELIARKIKINPEYPRKIIHVLSALSVIFIYYTFGSKYVVLVSFVFLIIMLVARKFMIWKSLYGVRRKSWGEITFVIGVGVLALLAGDNKVFYLGMFALAFADTAGWLIGNLIKSRKLINDKSLTGTSAVFLASILFGFMILGINNYPRIILFGIVISVLELFSKDGLDNMTIPIGALILDLF